MCQIWYVISVLFSFSSELHFWKVKGEFVLVHFADMLLQ